VSPFDKELLFAKILIFKACRISIFHYLVAATGEWQVKTFTKPITGAPLSLQTEAFTGDPSESLSLFWVRL
jgi:hypothetical protein